MEQINRYGSMAFLGYHAAKQEDIDKWIQFVKQGGTLLLTWPHLFTQTNRAKVICGESELVAGQEELTGVYLDGFLSVGEYMMGSVRLGTDTEVLQEHNGLPLVIRHLLGKGSVILVNVREYPAAAGVRPVYENLLTQLGESEAAVQRKKGWMYTQDRVEFSAYDDSEGERRIYAINTNWWQTEEQPAKAELLLGEKSYPVLINRDVIHIFTVCGNFAVWTADDETEVLSVASDRLQIQGMGTTTIRIVGDFSSVYADGFQVLQSDPNVWSLTGDIKEICEISLILQENIC